MTQTKDRIGRHRRRPRSYGLAGVVAVGLIVVARLIGPNVIPTWGCTDITVVSSSEKAALLGDIAATYTDAHRSVEGTCGAVHVVAKSSGDAAADLAAHWDEQRDGPRPDVWTPVTSSWLQIVRQ